MSEILKKDDCPEYYLLADTSKLCQKYQDGDTYCLCDNRVRFGECPKGCKE